MKPRKIESGVMEPDMTPMIDVVFQLLTFFMIALNFENTEADERVRLPREQIARPPVVRPESELVLNLGYRRTATGRKLDTTPYVFHNGNEVDVRDMPAVIEQERRTLEQAGGRDPRAATRATVVIRADDDVPTGIVQELVRQCQQAGFSRFSLRAADSVE